MELFLCVRSGAKAIDRRVVTQEQIDTGGDSRSHDIEVIASFLHHHQAAIAEGLSEVDDYFCELCKASRGEIHLAKRVVPVCIKAGRNQNELWIKPISGGRHNLSKDGFVDLVTDRRWQWDIDGCTQTCPCATLIGVAGAGIKRRLMYRKIEYARVSIEYVLYTIPVMDIVVYNHHPLEAVVVERILSGNGYIVEEAEPHGF